MRIDQYLVLNGFCCDEKEAQAYLMSGNVLVNDQKITKSGTEVSCSSQIRLLGQKKKYVSRGAEKLESALKSMEISIQNRIAMDIGISTGGFTDYLIQHGATRVFGIDVGYGIVDQKIRQNSACVLLERTNARHLKKEDLVRAVKKSKTPLTEIDHIDLVVMDVSFISVTQIMPVLASLCLPSTDFLLMLKPQFEAYRNEIEEGGVIRSQEKREDIISRVLKELSHQGFVCKAKKDSDVLGPKGNIETFVWIKNACEILN